MRESTRIWARRAGLGTVVLAGMGSITGCGSPKLDSQLPEEKGAAMTAERLQNLTPEQKAMVQNRDKMRMPAGAQPGRSGAPGTAGSTNQ